MARTPNDPTLNELANELRETQFLDSLHEFADRSDTPLNELRRVYSMPNGKTWAVRMFLGGQNRCIGYTDDINAACRFADMAAWRFWKYRTRGARPPTDGELNFSAEVAKSDCFNETNASYLISRIESHLRNNGTLPEYKELEAEREANRKKRDARRTVRNDMAMFFDDVHKMLKSIDARLEGLERKLFKHDVTVPHPLQMPMRIKHDVTVPHPLQMPVRMQTQCDVTEAMSAPAALDIFNDSLPTPTNSIT